MKQKTVSKTKDARPMFTVRVGWMMLGEHRIHADSREEAKSIARNLPVPNKAIYVDGSLDVYDD